MPFDPGASGPIVPGNGASLPNEGHISVIMIPERPPPQYSEVGELDTQLELSDVSMEVLHHQGNHHPPPRGFGAGPESSMPRRPRGQVQPGQSAATVITRTPAVYGRPRTSHNFPTSSRYVNISCVRKLSYSLSSRIKFSSRRRSETHLTSANRPLTSRGTFPADIPEIHLTTSGTIRQQVTNEENGKTTQMTNF